MRSIFANAKNSLERENVDGQCAQTDILMPISSPVPGSEQTRIDRIFPVKDGMTAWISHDVELQQACGGFYLLERIDRPAVGHAFVRVRRASSACWSHAAQDRRVERSQVDVERKTDPVAAHGVVGLVPAEKPVILSCDLTQVIDDLPLADQRGDFLQVFKRTDLLCESRIDVHAQHRRSRAQRTQFS